MSIKTVFAALSAGVALAACVAPSPELGKLTDPLTTGDANNKSLEVQAYLAFQDEDRLLRFLSRGTYSCGDPRLAAIRAHAKSTDPIKDVKTRYEKNPDYVSAMDTLTKYQGKLTSIVERTKNGGATLSSGATLLEALAALGDNTSIPGGAIGALATVAERFRIAELRAELIKAANDATPKLKAAAIQLQRAYEQLEIDRNQTYRIWDECARERLIFIRDAPLGKVPGYDAYFEQSSGIELANSYSEYRAKRRLLAATTDLREALKTIITANEKLAMGEGAIALKELLDASAELAKANKAFTDAEAKESERLKKEKGQKINEANAAAGNASR